MLDREGDGLLGAAAHGDVVSGQEVAEAEPLQAVDDRRDGTGFACPRQGVRVEVLLGSVVSQLQGGVAEVPQHVAVVHLVADGQRQVQGLAGRGPVAVGHVGHGDQHVPQTQRPGRVAGGRCRQELDGRQRGSAVGAVRAHDGRGDADLQGSGRVERVHRVGGLDEDPVGLGGRPEVDLDVSAQPRDVADQQGVGGIFTCRRQESLGLARLSARPRAAGCRER